MANNCTDPESIADGFFVIAKAYYVDGDKVYYYCKSGYFLEGNPIRECVGSSGNWTGSAPGCTQVTTTTTTSTSATTTTAEPISEWYYTSIGLGCVLAVLLLLLILAIFMKFSIGMCRQKKRSSDYEANSETGCCYACCERCCTRSCLQPKVVVEPTSNIELKSTGVQTSKDMETVSIGNIVMAKKQAKELNYYWLPHKHPTRDNNTSTH